MSTLIDQVEELNDSVKAFVEAVHQCVKDDCTKILRPFTKIAIERQMKPIVLPEFLNASVTALRVNLALNQFSKAMGGIRIKTNASISGHTNRLSDHQSTKQRNTNEESKAE